MSDLRQLREVDMTSWRSAMLTSIWLTSDHPRRSARPARNFATHATTTTRKGLSVCFSAMIGKPALDGRLIHRGSTRSVDPGARGSAFRPFLSCIRCCSSALTLILGFVLKAPLNSNQPTKPWTWTSSFRPKSVSLILILIICLSGAVCVCEMWLETERNLKVTNSHRDSNGLTFSQPFIINNLAIKGGISVNHNVVEKIVEDSPSAKLHSTLH